MRHIWLCDVKDMAVLDSAVSWHHHGVFCTCEYIREIMTKCENTAVPVKELTTRYVLRKSWTVLASHQDDKMVWPWFKLLWYSRFKNENEILIQRIVWLENSWTTWKNVLVLQSNIFWSPSLIKAQKYSKELLKKGKNVENYLFKDFFKTMVGYSYQN